MSIALPASGAARAETYLHGPQAPQGMGMKYRVEIEIEVPVDSLEEAKAAVADMMAYSVARAYFRGSRSGRVLAEYDDDEWIEHE